jgi:outer membrane protein
LEFNDPIFNGFAVRNNVDRSWFRTIKIAVEQQDLDLQGMYLLDLQMLKSAKCIRIGHYSCRSRNKVLTIMLKKKYDVGLMNSFDFNQAQTLLTMHNQMC